MDDSTRLPSVDHVVNFLEQNAHDETRACLDQIETAPASDRKTVLRSLKSVAEAHPSVLAPAASALARFLEDDERSVRLTTAELFVTRAESTPETVVPVVSSLAERLAAADEFYYVRARCAEALGLLARVERDDVALPESRLEELTADDDAEPFVINRVRFVLESVDQSDTPDQVPNEIGSLSGVRNTTSEAVDAITAPDSDEECPHCGLALPENGLRCVRNVEHRIEMPTIFRPA